MLVLWSSYQFGDRRKIDLVALLLTLFQCVCVCVCACMRACVRAYLPFGSRGTNGTNSLKQRIELPRSKLTIIEIAKA